MPFDFYDRSRMWDFILGKVFFLLLGVLVLGVLLYPTFTLFELFIYTSDWSWSEVLFQTAVALGCGYVIVNNAKGAKEEAFDELIILIKELRRGNKLVIDTQINGKKEEQESGAYGEPIPRYYVIVGHKRYKISRDKYSQALIGQKITIHEIPDSGRVLRVELEN